MSDILQLIKNRRTIRKYKKKKIPKRTIDNILAAGIWGPSIHGVQPWKYVVIGKKKYLESIARIFAEKVKEIGVPGFIAYPTFVCLKNPQFLICVYNTEAFSTLAKKFGHGFVRNAQIAEISAIAASIQNMILVAENKKIGCCWLDSLLFCQNEINSLLSIQKKLIAVLTFGHSAEEGRRSLRKSKHETVEYIL